MRVIIKNIGKIRDANIELNGLTVITGKNDTGKTTVGKVVYSMMASTERLSETSFIDKKNHIVNELITDTLNYINRRLIDKKIENNSVSPILNSVINELQKGRLLENEVDLSSDFDVIILNVKNEILKLGLGDAEEFYTKMSEKKKEIFNELGNIYNSGAYVVEKINQLLKSEFYYQILPVSRKVSYGETVLFNDSGTYTFNIHVNNNGIIGEDSAILGDLVDWNVEFIDDVNLIDKLHKANVDAVSHQINLLNKLNSEKNNIYDRLVDKQKTDETLKLVKEVFPDEIVFSETGNAVIKSSGLNIQNLALGSKCFAIIKMLIEKNMVTDKTVIILDEPEVHLHPEWINIFAEVLVSLAKKVGTKILITTHSTHFSLALEKMADKLEAKELYNAYISKVEDDGVVFDNVTDDSNRFYYELAKPLFELEKLGGDED